MRRAGGIFLLLLFLITVLVSGRAGADSWTWRDRGGTQRLLSVKSVTAGHNARGPTVTITFDRPLSPKQMGRKDFIVVDIESDGTGKSEEWIYLVSYRGRLRRFSFNPTTKTTSPIHGSSFSRPSPRSLRLQVTPYAPGWSHALAVGTYTKSAPGCAAGCWDVTPNRGWLIHDWTPPQVKGVREPPTWTFEETVQFYWEALDYGLSGFRRSSLLVSEPGSGKWEVVTTRTEPGRYRVSIPVEPGANLLLRPVAQDWAGHKALGPIRRTRVPYDQANPKAPATFTGLWSEEETDAYGGTIHRATAPLDSMQFGGRGDLYCVFVRVGPEPVSATLEAGGETVAIDTYSGTFDGQPPCVSTPGIDDHTATLTVHAGTPGVDAFWFGVREPAYADSEEAEHAGPVVGTSSGERSSRGALETGGSIVRSALSR